MTLDHGHGVPGIVAVTASTDRIPISFEATAARDRALVFVHGWSCDRRYWRHQVPAFADDYQVVTLDLAGHGASGAGRSSWTMAAFGADVIAVADALELADMVLIGHSMGGDVIVEAALGLGERVAGIIWVDTYSRLTTPSTTNQVTESLQPFRADFSAATRAFVRGLFPATARPQLVEEIVADMSSAPPDIALDALRHAWSNSGPMMAALPTLDVPVIAINADSGSTDSASLAAFGIQTVIATGVGHFLMLEDPDQFDGLLADALATRFRPPTSAPHRLMP